MPQSRVNSAGQIELPRTILQYLDLRAGDKVDFERTKDGRIVIRKVGVPKPVPLVRVTGKAALDEVEVEVKHDEDRDRV